MSGFTHINLSDLPAPQVLETVEYEQTLADMKADLLDKYPAADLESEPLIALLEVNAYYRVLDRQRVNDAAKAVMLAHASGADLENIGAFYGASRLVVDAGDPEATPPVPPTYESNSAFRARIQIALEAQTTAGPRGAYLYHTLTADGQVLDAYVHSPAPGTVEVVVLAQDGAPDAALLDTVEAALNAQDVRPLCDTVQVRGATLVPYTVEATLTYYDGPDQGVVSAQAEAAVEAYVAKSFRLGRDVTRSGLFAALHQPGVQNVDLTAPAADVVIAADEAAQIDTITITGGGVDV